MKDKIIYVFLVLGLACLPFISFNSVKLGIHCGGEASCQSSDKGFPSANFLSKGLKFSSQIIAMQNLSAEMEKDLGEMATDLNSLLNLNSQLEEQVKMAVKFGVIAKEQIVFVQGALTALQRLKSQTAYTNTLVYKTLVINQQTENQSKIVSNVSKNLENKSKVMMDISSRIKRGMEDSVQQMRIMKEKLPKNMPM